MTPLEKAARVAYGLPDRTRTFHSDWGLDLSEHARDAAAIIRARHENTPAPASAGDQDAPDRRKDDGGNASPDFLI